MTEQFNIHLVLFMGQMVNRAIAPACIRHERHHYSLHKPHILTVFLTVIKYLCWHIQIYQRDRLQNLVEGPETVHSVYTFRSLQCTQSQIQNNILKIVSWWSCLCILFLKMNGLVLIISWRLLSYTGCIQRLGELFKCLAIWENSFCGTNYNITSNASRL